MERFRNSLCRGAVSSHGYAVALQGRSAIRYRDRSLDLAFEGELMSDGSWALYSQHFSVRRGELGDSVGLDEVIDRIIRAFEYLRRDLDVQ